MPWSVLVATALLATVHAWAARLRSLDVVPRSRWLSFAGGSSVAYVFLHWLPELAHSDDTLARGDALHWIPSSYVIALLGLAAFYGLERWAVRTRPPEGPDKGRATPPPRVFWSHVGAFAAYNALIGYLLHDAEDAGGVTFGLYVVALGLHLFVVDHGLYAHHQHRYREVGRWLLVAGLVAGAVLGLVTTLHEDVVAVALSLLAGAIVLNVLKEELPEERESRFWAFAVGVAGYGALLLAL